MPCASKAPTLGLGPSEILTNCGAANVHCCPTAAALNRQESLWSSDLVSHIYRSRAFLIAVAALFIAACDDTTLPNNVPFGAVVTLVDSGVALSTARTFAMPDTIVEVGGGVGFNHAEDKTVVARIRSHLLANGWTEVKGPGANPDVVVLNAAATRIESGIAYTDWYGAWGYLPYWGPAVNASWAWGVPAGALPYAFQAGTLLTVMLDVRGPRNVETREIPLLWAAAVDGVVSGGSTTARVLAGVDQAFAQSPYLKVLR
jgi:hypothetical protein